MSGPRRLSEVLVRDAKRRHRHDRNAYSIAKLARRYGVPADWLAEEFVRLETGDRRSNERRDAAAEAGRAGASRPVDAARRALAKRLVANEASDTRDLTARLCGDPLPGRSALGQRRSAGGPG